MCLSSGQHPKEHLYNCRWWATIILPSRLSTSFVRNICWLNNGNTHPPAGEAPGEQLKINELGPKFLGECSVDETPDTSCSSPASCRHCLSFHFGRRSFQHGSRVLLWRHVIPFQFTPLLLYGRPAAEEMAEVINNRKVSVESLWCWVTLGDVVYILASYPGHVAWVQG